MNFFAFFWIFVIFCAGSASPMLIAPKCCPAGETIDERTKLCVPSNNSFDPRFWFPNNATYSDDSEEVLGLIIGNPCRYGRFKLEPYKDSNDDFRLLPNGSLYVPHYYSNRFLSVREFCMETFQIDDDYVDVLPLLCFEPPEKPKSGYWITCIITVFPAGLLLSCGFLMATVIVYSTKAELRNIWGFALISHNSCIITVFLLLSFVEYNRYEFTDQVCVLLCYAAQYFYSASTFWLNVMCFIVLQKCRKKSTLLLKVKYCKIRRLYLYNIYAWTCPAILSTTMYLLDLKPAIPNFYLKPNQFYKECNTALNVQELLSFLIPTLLQSAINMCLLKFSYEYLKIKNVDYSSIILHESERIKTAVCRKQLLFYQCIFVFVAMHLIWINQLVKYLDLDDIVLFPVIDIVNLIQGVVIFFALVILKGKCNAFRN